MSFFKTISKRFACRKWPLFFVAVTIGAFPFARYVVRPLKRFLQRHHYKSLQTRSIRLIQFVPGRSRGPIQLRLLDFHLDCCPPYECLSYTWDEAIDKEVDPTAIEPDISQFVLVNGGYLWVTSNLAGFLNLWDQAAFDGWIWIDAICINQTDILERSSQVAMMDEIYAKAGRVTIWLGQPLARLDSFFWIHDVFFPALETYCADSESPDNFSILHPDFFNALQLPVSYEGYVEAWRDYIMFYESRRWFSRAWVLQEATLAEEILVVCGNIFLSWDVMARLAACLGNIGWGQQLLLLKSDEGTHSRRIGVDIYTASVFRQCRKDLLKMHESSAAELGEDLPMHIRHLIWTNIGERAAKDSRDHVYATLGLFRQMLPAHIVPHMAVNYKDDVATVAGTFVTQLIATDPRARVLAEAKGGTKLPIVSQPTWVPYVRSSEHGGAFLRRLQAAQFNAFPMTCSTPSRTPVVSGQSVLLHGKSVDKIKAVCPLMSGDAIFRSQLHLRLIEFCTQLHTVRTAYGQGRWEALSRAMIADLQIACPGTSAEDFGKACIAGFRDWLSTSLVQSIQFLQIENAITKDEVDQTLASLQWLQEVELDQNAFPMEAAIRAEVEMQNTLLGHIQRNPDQWLNQFKANFAEWTGSTTSHYAHALSEVADRSCLFITSNNYIGVAPLDTQINDDIVFFDAGITPLVLRRQKNGTYNLLGDAVLHGYMHGEMITSDFLESLEVLTVV